MKFISRINDLATDHFMTYNRVNKYNFALHAGSRIGRFDMGSTGMGRWANVMTPSWTTPFYMSNSGSHPAISASWSMDSKVSILFSEDYWVKHWNREK